uniref:Putative adenine deaminase n=1 Tax=Pelagibacter ubique TaxID=198252 RepID=B1A0Q2_PELUQ|nr:putative adenine deaminase [Candidatus Pelagibacter ubique]
MLCFAGTAVIAALHQSRNVLRSAANVAWHDKNLYSLPLGPYRRDQRSGKEENVAKGEFASWADCAADLVAVAAGRSSADLVVQNSRLVNVQSREVLENWQIAVVRGRFAYVGPDARHCIGPKTQIIDAGGRYLIPGLCDGHMHIESGMLIPAEFALPAQCTGIIAFVFLVIAETILLSSIL